MILQYCPEPIDRIEGGRGNVVECSPVIGNEVSSLQSLKESQSILAGQMPLPKAWFPPGCVPDGEKRQVESAPFGSEMILT
jgi:hypothetical protein